MQSNHNILFTFIVAKLPKFMHVLNETMKRFFKIEENEQSKQKCDLQSVLVRFLPSFNIGRVKLHSYLVWLYSFYSVQPNFCTLCTPELLQRSSAAQCVHSTARLIIQFFPLVWTSVPADLEEDS